MRIFREPLAHLIRPRTLEDFFGQEDVVGGGKLLKQLIEQDNLHSAIFFGPPGCGKTTLAHIIASATSANFRMLSAVTGGVPEIRKVVEEAQEFRRLGQKTVLFVDEIHRFSKSQQDALLPHTEDGTLILIGATTENPSFEVVSALLSRSQVFVFKALEQQAMLGILARALKKTAEYLQESEIVMDEDAQKFIISFANGDARILLNNLEIVLKMLDKNHISLEDVNGVLQRKNLRYDKNGEEHYNIISALHKSLRDSDPDGALYWLGRMLVAGEDPLYIARRLIRFASEDIGMADPHALLVAVAAKDACHFLGMPECNVNLGQCVVYLAMAPKSNAVYEAVNRVNEVIQATGNLEVPLHIRNAPTKLMKEWGYGKGYKYAHSFEGAKLAQQHLPDQLSNERFYFPTDRGIEVKIKDRLDQKRTI